MPVIPDPIANVDFDEEEYRIPFVLLLDESYSLAGAFVRERNYRLTELSKALGMPGIFDPIPDVSEGEHKIDVIFLIDSTDGPMEIIDPYQGLIDKYQQMLESEGAVWEDYSAPCLSKFRISDLGPDLLMAFHPVSKYKLRNKVKKYVLDTLKEPRAQGARDYRP